MSDFAESNVIHADAAVQSALEGLEGQFHDLQKQVDALQRLAGLGTVCAMIAHECNNIMTPIISYCQYALQKGEADLMRTAVERSLKNAQKLSSLCSRLLSLASPADEELGEIPVRAAIDDAVTSLGRDLEKDSISLTTDIAEGLIVRGHPASLQQVLFNLLLNARQAMLGKPGRLTITAKPSAGGTEIEITDTGCGIKAGDLSRLFEPFFSTKRHEVRAEKGGAGLGLHVCKRLMEQMGGEISVRSTPGQGTTFRLTFP
ncbi:MAG TPA: HAMP domain-containing sensor histidine kinase [Phycisphaerae bacterium]|nr:HAMP domain-containing sensor histidine kinase [Phycisphaerae bacterium]